jgi:ABC-type glycerol-3-phosphate transport system substrate-binding protein
MKTLIVVLLSLVLAACGGEDADPKPQFDCAQLKREVASARAAWQGHVNTRPYITLAKDIQAWQEKETALEKDWIAKHKLCNDNCN